VDNDLKRYAGERFNLEKIASILAAHEKKMDARLKTAEGIAPKIVHSRLALMAIIASVTKRGSEEKDSIRKEVEAFVAICNLSEEITSYVQNKK
jgi:hypothetical protein